MAGLELLPDSEPTLDALCILAENSPPPSRLPYAPVEEVETLPDNVDQNWLHKHYLQLCAREDIQPADRLLSVLADVPDVLRQAWKRKTAPPSLVSTGDGGIALPS